MTRFGLPRSPQIRRVAAPLPVFLHLALHDARLYEPAIAPGVQCKVDAHGVPSASHSAERLAPIDNCVSRRARSPASGCYMILGGEPRQA